MLLVDDRAGSQDLIAPLRKLGAQVEETRLDFGDVAFEGRGVKGKPVMVGIEFKKLGELVQALRTQRLTGHQLPGMRDIYDYAYLFVEGEWNYDRAGMLLRRKGARRFAPMGGSMTVSELLKRMFVLHLQGGLNPWWTVSRQDTLNSILALYRTWTDRNLDQHKSHMGIYVAPPMVPISDERRTLSTFPHIGTRGSQAVFQQFGSIARAVGAGVDEWASVTTVDEAGKPRRLGLKYATDIWEFLRRTP